MIRQTGAAKGAGMTSLGEPAVSLRTSPIPPTMRALRKAAAAPGFALEHIPVPEIGPSDVLIRVKTVCLCGTDLHIYCWDLWSQRRVKPPLTIRHEFIRVVPAVGPPLLPFSV